MSRLIVDSGSTKALWCFDTPQGTQFQETAGINPYHQSKETIHAIVTSVTVETPIEACYFYGAGCTDPEVFQPLLEILEAHFKTSIVEVNGDMLGAARGLLQRSKGVAAILGTGSNSCFYDGENIVDNIEAGGYILGDEGSGTYLGKMLLKDFLRKEMPQSLYDQLTKDGISNAMILKNVYRSEMPNKYLASFSKTHLALNRDTSYVNRLIKSAFSDFFNAHIVKYEGYDTVAFIGSIAFNYQQELTEVARKYGVNELIIKKNPIEGLINYHKHTST